MSPHQRSSKRSGRSNMYSESKCTNWSRFDPYRGEMTALPENLKPTLTFRIDASETCDIYERPVHRAFLRPFGAADVEAILKTVPGEFLAGLCGIYLLGGTGKQDKVAWGDLYRYGEYSRSGIIHLWAFPRRCLRMRCKGPAKPDIRQGYERAGATYRKEGRDWILEFDEESLKAFYLRDVLLHEIAHHVDRHNRKSDHQSERFAEWFVREHGFRKDR